MELTGTVSSGLGRAHVFMAQPHYQEQFRTVLGSKAWPGTLNMEIDKAMLSHYIALRQKQASTPSTHRKTTGRQPRRSTSHRTSEFAFVDFFETGCRLAGRRPSKASSITANKPWNARS